MKIKITEREVIEEKSNVKFMVNGKIKKEFGSLDKAREAMEKYNDKTKDDDKRGKETYISYSLKKVA